MFAIKALNLFAPQVLQLNISSQQSTIDNLNEKGLNLKRTSKDGNLGSQIAHVVQRYENLTRKAKVIKKAHQWLYNT